MIPLTNTQIRAFKAQAQRLKAMLKIGEEGISAGRRFVAEGRGAFVLRV